MAKRPNLIRLRKAAGLTQEQVAKALNDTTFHVSSMEKGYREIPRPMAEKMAKLYGCSVEDLGITRPERAYERKGQG